MDGNVLGYWPLDGGGEDAGPVGLDSVPEGVEGTWGRHNTPRPTSYLRDRVRPTPMVRFLVSTESEPTDGGDYPYRTYRLHFGDPRAEPSPLRQDGGLLTRARGWVGWWRFDELRGSTLRDESANGLDARVSMGWLDPPREGPQGLASENQIVAEVPSHPALEGTEAITVEVLATRTGFGASPLVSRQGGFDGDHGLELITRDSVGVRRTAMGSGTTWEPELVWAAGTPVHVAFTAGPGDVDDAGGGLSLYQDHEEVCPMFQGASGGEPGPCPVHLGAEETFASGAPLFLGGIPGAWEGEGVSFPGVI